MVDTSPGSSNSTLAAERATCSRMVGIHGQRCSGSHHWEWQRPESERRLAPRPARHQEIQLAGVDLNVVGKLFPEVAPARLLRLRAPTLRGPWFSGAG